MRFTVALLMEWNGQRGDSRGEQPNAEIFPARSVLLLGTSHRKEGGKVCFTGHIPTWLAKVDFTSISVMTNERLDKTHTVFWQAATRPWPLYAGWIIKYYPTLH